MELIEKIKDGDLESIKNLLLKHPELAEQTDVTGVSALMTAIYYGRSEIANVIYQALGSISFFEACAFGMVNEVQNHLAENPSAVKLFSVDGFTGLGFAAFFGKIEVAKLLLETNAPVDAESINPLKVTPLGSAAAGDHIEIARSLLEHHANPDHQQSGGFTPLHSACQNSSIEMVKLLRSFSANPKIRTDDGKLPQDFLPQGSDPLYFELLS